MNCETELAEFLNKEPVSQAEAFQFFDQLESVSLDFMSGLWKGSGCRTGHPFDGLLEAAGWYGKEFIDAETVHPLVFRHQRGFLYKVNPGLLPFTFLLSYIPRKLVRLLFPLVSPLLQTRKAKARMRMMEYRGIVSAAMIYDQHSVYDTFRKIDENTVIGAMDWKGQPDMAYFFLLERV